MSMSIMCPDCNGTGVHYTKRGKRVVCDRCNGTGEIPRWMDDGGLKYK
jgi:DnaJ-class molecular chaperone